MGRRSTFDDSAVYAAVGAEVAETGHFTLQALSNATGISTGSVYHRFHSREGLLAETWLDAVQSFQSRFLDAIREADIATGEEAALATPRFCRSEPEKAVTLACCRQEDFVRPETPSALAAEIRSINDEVSKEVRAFAQRVQRPLLACRLALAAYPLAAVKTYLPQQRVPKALDAEILKAYRAALA